MFHPRTPKTKPTELIRIAVENKANELVRAVLKPRHIQPPPDNQKYNYVIDIYTKWHHSYFYFYAIYCCPFPNAISPTFDEKFARMEYAGKNQFNLSYMRHTRQWQEIYSGLSLDECLAKIRDEEHFGI
ncbi:MAG TPA: hypothetical protein PKH70_03875 [Syntrophorhabdaceae bacterium]|nr:MAG: hypothetical protein BWX92_01027 [Deltaproteobacteria bacterium ADurb.Bin135]HNQ63092.1 hypothetical protein [Syntrophorhabdaceae bacterium]